MWYKIVHYLVLLCYFNILVYQPEIDVVRQDDSFLNGESLLEFVLDDVLDLPIDEDTADVEIRYDEYRAYGYQGASLPLFILVFAVLFSFKQFASYSKHPVYAGKKRQIIPEYYRYLYRLQPF